MPYEPNQIKETAGILGVAFLVGVIAQFLRQKSDESVERRNIVWLSIASGFSAMVAIGILYEYTGISPAFLVAISGLAGWAGISILSTMSKALDQVLIKGAEQKLDVKIDREVSITEAEEVNDEHVNRPTHMGSQTE